MSDCPDSTVWPAVTNLKNGDDVDAITLNKPIRELTTRTDHLLRLLNRVDHTKLVVIDADLASGDANPGVGQVVYRTSDGTYAVACGRTEEEAWFYAAPEAMAVGIIASKGSPDATVGTVVLCGYVSFDDDVPVADVIADEDPVSGRYYLSNTVAGKLTADPSGPVIYVCDCNIVDGIVKSMIVNPQYRDTGESHIHRSFVLDWKPQGGYDEAVGGVYKVYGCLPDGTNPDDDDVADLLRLHLCGLWTGSGPVEYEFTLKADTNAPAGSTGWAQYCVGYTEDNGTEETINLGDLEGAGHTKTDAVEIGTHHLKVVFERAESLTPSTAIANNTWTVTMPDAGRGWLQAPKDDGFILNLGMYPAMARYVPLLPSNSGALVVGGVELRGPEFGDQCEWCMYPVGAQEGSGEDAVAFPEGGPWLKWVGNSVVADGDSVTTPWGHVGGAPSVRHIVLHAGRMRVGPTGFVTSLQPAPGSPLKITSALTDAVAKRGALQVGMDIDFKSANGNAAGHQVVKQINGTTFITGPVVERVVPGPGLSANQEQGIVRLSVSNAIYAGDFETIALRNAKQDLAGGVFPYTKLLGWTTGGQSNVESGFTAKFRVPDHIPYNAGRGYYVVVSASVFGEADKKTDSAAAFSMSCYTLSDQACSPDAPVSGDIEAGGSIASPTAGRTVNVAVPFTGEYAAFDPVLVHGFGNSSGSGPGAVVLADTPQRRSVDGMWLKDAEGMPVVVYPGYFVGLSIRRQGTGGVEYTAPIGFLSLRWNLVEVPARA